MELNRDLGDAGEIQWHKDRSGIHGKKIKHFSAEKDKSKYI